MLINSFCIITLYLIYNDTCIRYHINYIKCINNIPARFFSYLLFNMKPDTINIIISCITNYKLSVIDIFSLINRYCNYKICNLNDTLKLLYIYFLKFQDLCLQGNVAFSSQGDRIAWTKIEQLISKYIFMTY